ncbi:MAG: class I SAM-dependent methyltransferase [Acidimicrobiales bacterium]
MARLTGERPQQGVTPDSLLALHDAGYRAVIERLGPGRILDLGCGQGFESVQFLGADRLVVGADYDQGALTGAAGHFGNTGLRLLRSDAARLALGDGSFDWVCSSHLVEHFLRPEEHVAEVARVLAPGGSAFVITPNAPADFENPFHVHLFRRDALAALLGSYFDDVWVGGLDAVAAVKTDLVNRRAKAARLLALDVFDLRHRLPRSWYLGVYTRILPVAYRLLARDDSGGATGITADDFFVTDEVDDTTLVLFAVARHRGRRAA